MLLASIALTGNSGSNNGALAFQHRLSDAVHLVASGVWIGALVVFSRLVTMSVRQDRLDDLQMVHDALARFAGVGTAAVAILTLSGMTNPGFFQSSLDTAYGQLLLAKLGVFGAMLALAGANRFFLTPRLSATLEWTGWIEDGDHRAPREHPDRDGAWRDRARDGRLAWRASSAIIRPAAPVQLTLVQHHAGGADARAYRSGRKYLLRLCQGEPHFRNLKPDNSLALASSALRIDLAGHESVPIDIAALSHA